MSRLYHFICAGIFVFTSACTGAETQDVQIRVDAAQTVRTMGSGLLGVNAAVWDSHLDTAGTISALREMGLQTLRFPGGSAADDYHWSAGRGGTNIGKWPVSFDQFAQVATNLHAQVFITVNYGSGTPEEAAAWVRHANITNRYGFKFWEIGNENYGGWEHDENVPPHDPLTYATRAKKYYRQMKAADPAIKIGVVVADGHQGWTPAVLGALRQMAVTPDFVIYHCYPQNAGGENDAELLQSTVRWPHEAMELRRQLKDCFGDAGTNVELMCTENNSISEKPGKQTTSLVNALYLADSFGQLAQTEFNALVWWDLRNGRALGNNNNPALYGWRDYGDYGILAGATSRYPVFYAAKLLKYFARGGDRLLRVTSDNQLLSVYAAQRADGTMSLLVINKSPDTGLKADFSITGFQPTAGATIYSYGIPQDEAARTGIGSPDIAQADFPRAAAKFSRSFMPYSATVTVFSPVSVSNRP